MQGHMDVDNKVSDFHSNIALPKRDVDTYTHMYPPLYLKRVYSEVSVGNNFVDLLNSVPSFLTKLIWAKSRI